MSEWISVEDRLPEPGIFVLVSFPGYPESLGVGINIYSAAHGWELKQTDSYAAGITHWQPLPPLPEVE